MTFGESLQIVQNIAILGGMVFGVYIYFRKPQETLDKQFAINEKEEQGKAMILAQQLQWEKDSNERRFKELNDQLTAQTALAMNHTHATDVKIDNLASLMGSMNVNFSKEISALATEVRLMREKH